MIFYLLQNYEGTNASTETYSTSYESSIIQLLAAERTSVTIMCRNDELSWFFTKRFGAFYLICIKKSNPFQSFCYSHSLNFHVSGSPESVCKQPTQLIVKLNSSLQNIIVTKISISLKITCNLSKIGQISDFQHGWLGGLDIAVLVHVLDFSGTHLSSWVFQMAFEGH